MPSASYRPLQPNVKPCRSCRAPMFFVTIAKTGKNMPVDAAPAPDGTIVLIDPKTAVVLGPEAAALETGRRYRPHWATCPDSQAWRRARGIPEP